ncbi:apolipoprotein D-like isoform X2 [Panulirus ornatus]|uniref:apolipoprotein D-like isoform X2 n=1 Tax=Panulirus ornatus TaxID=150431 RepID=UPI003A8B9B5C
MGADHVLHIMNILFTGMGRATPWSQMQVGLVMLVMVMGAVIGHDWGWGRCPRADPFPKLSVNKLLGLWYVIEQIDTTSTCLTMNFTRVTPTQLKVTKSRQLLLLDTLSIEHLNSYTATLDIPDGENAGKMRVKWPLNLAGKADYIVFDTDYETYAAIYECQPFTSFAHRQSATILSRSRALNSTIIDKIKQQLKSFGIETQDFDVIDHASCIKPEDSDLRINIDEETLKKILGDAADGFKNVASQLMTFFQVADGASDFASTVFDVTRRLGASTDGSSDPNAAISITSDAELIQ